MPKKRDPGTGEGWEEPSRWAAIHRFLDNVSSLPERQMVERWMRDDLSVQRYIKAHKKVWSMIGRRLGVRPIDPDDAWESIQDRIAEHDRRERFSLPGRGLEHLRIIDGGQSDAARPRRQLPWRVMSASAALLLIGTAYAISRVAYGTSVPVTYVANRGETPQEQRLPDGVRFVLAPDSRLSYAPDRQGHHVATLVGEASFTVEHRSDRVFVVDAGGFETRDLGTEFDIRAYPDVPTRVAVRQGQVSVQGGNFKRVVEAGQLLELPSSAGISAVVSTGEDAFAWISGRLVFHNVPLREVVAQIGRTYDVDIQVTDAKLAAYPVTMTASGGTVDRALALLKVVMPGLQYERDGQIVRLFRQ